MLHIGLDLESKEVIEQLETNNNDKKSHLNEKASTLNNTGADIILEKDVKNTSSYLIATIDDKELRKKLRVFRDTEIMKDYTIDKRCILSDLMIEQFIKYKPVDIDEWYDIPKKLRENIDGDQTIYLEDIFEIIEMSV